MSYDRCPNCQGKKRILGLGNMYKDCDGCNGVGYVAPASVVKIDKRTRAYKKKKAV